MIKSDIGDIKNTGGRWGGASTAAEFLHVFAEDTPWIHLDIAGVAWVEDSQALHRQGPERDRGAVDPGVGAEVLSRLYLFQSSRALLPMRRIA